ncbi:uncharacterized protein LOC116014792 isoform X2 [Ipomoea triloba]|uniref:uncharacterized protein LOC116014792 isoform X2 n=1 Tax=Ipomoea triloba TaxID=35885 RepID=UPI00125DBF6F|nr:uncharacterized protein LOC116014792 isoform X2 [Ipomoea triloba]
MVHLPIHLAYEAKVGGPVHYRWMYPFERFLHQLKKKVRNRNYVEGSICEAYLIEEISTFCSHYFEDHVQTRLNRVPRNDDGGDVNANNRLSIFTHPGRPLGQGKMVTRGRGRKYKTQVRGSSSCFAQGVDDDLTSNPSHFVNRHGLQSTHLNASLTDGQQSNAPPHVSPLSSGSQSNVRPDHVASISDGLQSDAPLLNTPLDDHVEEAIEDTVQSLHESATTLTKQTKRRGPNRGRALPSDPSRKIKLNVISGSDFLEDGVAADISAMVKSNFNDHWPTWAQFSDETKAAL